MKTMTQWIKWVDDKTPPLAFCLSLCNSKTLLELIDLEYFILYYLDLNQI